ncbi:aromatic ring-hydroxylating oxygenase subunit alpha [Paraburkholderia sp. D1E]|uniref:aromatic ring-hydroxylating oxygenase subunit alpha n=1 Tax=Paraburkholderia sp. D1E TaxID=3461398 RepID=UPI0040466D1A
MSIEPVPISFVPKWKDEGPSRIPFWVYTDQTVYQRELELIFYGKHWNFVGLEAELPNPGDFKRTWVGERSVILARNDDGSVNAVENICAHRGAAFCRERSGNRKEFLCPYHQWTYDLKGNLTGVPFRRGLKKDGEVRGGMPADFNPANHSLNKLNVAVRHGVIFASFDHDVEPLEDYLGPEILPYFDRTFDGRKLKIHGHARQRIPGNWKLMQENIKDPYHVGLLHTWFLMFGLIRGDQKSRIVMDRHGRHGAMESTREATGKGEVSAGLHSFKEDMHLHDERIIDIKREEWWNGPTVVMLTLFPNLIVQQQSNSMSVRQIIPRGTGAFDFVWTHFGFEDDDADMETRRMRQANMFGPAGYVSADDGEVLEFCQESYEQGDSARSTIAEQGGRDWSGSTHTITENVLRGMYAYWRKLMEI